MSDHSSSTFDNLMSWLDPDPERAAAEYLRINREVIRYFEKRGKEVEAPELTNKTFDRVEKKLSTSKLADEEPRNRLPYFLRTAGYIYLESFVRGGTYRPPMDEQSDDKGPLEDFKQCLSRCCSRLKPWRRSLKTEKCELLLVYYEDEWEDPETGEIITGSKNIRRRLAEWLGLKELALRVVIHRIREEIDPCIIRCMVSIGYSDAELSRLSI
jgi:hypothetical protein